MCRLLGFVSRQPTTLLQLLGRAELTQFTALSQKHGDGWGFAIATASGMEVTKAPDAARDSALFAEVAAEKAAEVGVLHLRWATLGLGVTAVNTHPFTDGQIAFTHNGSIRPPSSLDSLIPADFLSRINGTTDSERYFLALLGAARGTDLASAIEQVATQISDKCAFSSINAMIATPESLHVINLFDPIAEAGESEPNYYRIGYRIDADGVIVSSSGWGSGWTFLENGEMLSVDRATCDVQIRRVMPSSAAA